MKKRDILIVIVVIAFGIIYNEFKSNDFDVQFYKSIPAAAWQIKDKSYPNDFEREEIRCPQVDGIVIRNIAGDIEVEKAAAPELEASNPAIRIYPSIRVYHRNKSEAEEINRKILIKSSEATEINESENQNDKKEQKKYVKIEVKPKEDFPLKRARVRFKVVIPETAELTLITRYGDMVVDGCGKHIVLDGKHGDISVKHVDSTVNINHRNGRVVLTDIQNNIDLSSRDSRIKINNTSDLKLNCYLADVDISQVENNVHIDTAAYSTITIDDIYKCTIDARHTKIKLNNIKNNVQVKNSHQSIIMRNMTGDILINANNCKINLDQISSGDVVIKNAYNYVHIDRFSARTLSVLMRNGDLDVNIDKIEQKVNIKNRHSKITMAYPSTIKPVLNIQALYGKITNKTSEELVVLKERGRELLTSSYLEGKPEIVINTTYGDVRLETAVPRSE